MSCRCQGCNRPYRLDILVPDSLWEQIKPINKPTGGGLLCGTCIVERIEQLSEYGVLAANNSETVISYGHQ